MKIILTILLILMFISCSQPKKPQTIEIWVRCGIAGMTSPEIVKYKKLISSKDYKSLRYNLFSSSLMDQLLSTITLIELNNQKIVTLTEKELTKIEFIKKSNSLYEYCNTCVIHDNGKFSELFNKKLGIYNTIVYTLHLKEPFILGNDDDNAVCKSTIDSITKVEYYSYVDSMPEYPGGTKELYKFVLTHFKYAATIDTSGRIISSFIVDNKGNIKYIQIEKGLNKELDNEFIRVIKLMPSWLPGKCNGKPVSVKIFIPLKINPHSN